MNKKLGVHSFHFFFRRPLLAFIQNDCQSTQFIIIHLSRYCVLIYNNYLLSCQQEFPLTLFIPLVSLEHHCGQHDFDMVLRCQIDINCTHNLLITIYFQIIVEQFLLDGKLFQFDISLCFINLFTILL